MDLGQKTGVLACLETFTHRTCVGNDGWPTTAMHWQPIIVISTSTDAFLYSPCESQAIVLPCIVHVAPHTMAGVDTFSSDPNDTMLSSRLAENTRTQTPILTARGNCRSTRCHRS